MPFFSRTVLQLCNFTGLGVGTFTDANGGQVQIGGTAAAPVYAAAQELGRLVEFAAECQVLAGAGGSVTVTIQDSFDGISFNPWVAFAPITGIQTNPGQVVSITRNPGPIVRVQSTVAVGGSGYAVKVFLSGAERIG